MWMPLDYDWRRPSADARFCCPTMATALAFDCDQHETPFECPDGLLVHHEPFGEFGLVIHDGGWSYVLIDNCPFCGTKLPESGRDAWFDALEAAGLEDAAIDDLPPKYLTAEWRTA